jgi:hypothetical protein
MNYKKAAWCLIGGLTMLRLIYINLFPLLGDEAYYWQWSRHLDLGYYEQGPMTAIVIWLFTLFNRVNTVFTVRLGAVALSALTMALSVLIYRKIDRTDTGYKRAFFNLLFMSSSLIYSAGAVLMMHDTVMIFFFALFIYSMLHVVENPDNNKYWAHAGILLGLGVMSKYTLAVIYPALLVYFLTAGPIKNRLKGLTILSVFFLWSLAPVIYWNLTHDFATISFLIARKGSGSSFTFKYLLELIGGQIGLISVFLIPFMAAALARNLKSRGFKAGFMMAVLFIVSFIPFIFLSLKNRVEANWPAFCFFPLFFITTQFIFSIKNLKPWLLHSIYGAGILIVIMVHIQVVRPFLPLPGGMNALSKSYGYKELAEKMSGIYNKYAYNGPVFYSTRHYQAASLLSFYLPGQPDVYVLLDSGAIKNYRYWTGWKRLVNYNCIFAWSEDWETWEIEKFFKKHSFVEKIDIKCGDGCARSYNIDFLEGLKAF